MNIHTIICGLNWSGIIWGSVVAYILGAIWYSPALFANLWMKAQPHRSKKDYTNSTLAMTAQAVATFLLAVLCAILFRDLGGFFPTVFILSIVTMALTYASYLFLGHSYVLWLIDCGYRLVMIVVIGLALTLL